MFIRTTGTDKTIYSDRSFRDVRRPFKVIRGPSQILAICIHSTDKPDHLSNAELLHCRQHAMLAPTLQKREGGAKGEKGRGETGRKNARGGNTEKKRKSQVSGKWKRKGLEEREERGNGGKRVGNGKKMAERKIVIPIHLLTQFHSSSWAKQPVPMVFVLRFFSSMVTDWRFISPYCSTCVCGVVFYLEIYCIRYDTIRCNTRCYFNVRSKADMSQLNLPQGNDN